MSWLEQLVREYYEMQGYWVRTNVKFGPLGHGGYIGEADVLAFDPRKRLLVHVEPTMGSESWAKRRQTINAKFDKAAPYYDEMFPVAIHHKVRFAIAGWGLSSPPIEIPGIEILTVGQFVQRCQKLVAELFTGTSSPAEQFPLLRTMYFAMKWSL